MESALLDKAAMDRDMALGDAGPGLGSALDWTAENIHALNAKSLGGAGSHSFESPGFPRDTRYAQDGLSTEDRNARHSPLVNQQELMGGGYDPRRGGRPRTYGNAMGAAVPRRGFAVNKPQIRRLADYGDLTANP